MPKKRHLNFKQLQGSSSSSGRASPSKDGSSASSSVNERLNELRRLEGKDAAKKKAELAASVNQKSVPESLRGILGIAESAPPKPKRGGGGGGVRARMPNRTPGPAPPASWTKTPGWTPLLALRTGRRRFRPSGSADVERIRPEQLMRFARMVGIKSDAVDDHTPSTLVHLSLKTAAESWDLFDEQDLPALGDLPLQLRLRLISYLGFYGPAISPNILDILTGGTEPVTHLDLAGLIGQGGLRVKTLVRIAKFRSEEVPDTAHSHDELLESWDLDVDFEAALKFSPSISRFSGLTHLSLSHPSAGASWKDLLAFAKHIPSLTHLSLAHWLRPTLTPNLATATVSSQHSPDVSAGGSHFYSVLDQDMIEPASILRSLSSNLLRLKWLDLEGCTEWVPALAFYRDNEQPANSPPNTWSSTSSAPSIFLHNWKNLTYLNISQGHTPSMKALEDCGKQNISWAWREIIARYKDKLDWRAALSDEHETPDAVSVHKARLWLDLENRAFEAERKIEALRRAQSGKPVVVDHGWYRRL